MSDERPPEKPTTQLEKVPAWAVALTEKVQHGFSEVKADISLVANDVSIAKDRIGVVENRVKQLEDRSETNSVRARGASEVDMKHEAVIADIVVKVDSLTKTQETQLAILTRLDAVAANPMVRRVAYAVGAAVLAYLASKGWVAR